MEVAATILTHRAFLTTKEYAFGSITVEEATSRIIGLNEQLESLGYRLAVGKAGIRTTSLKPSLHVFQELHFCLLCERTSVIVCCGDQWCENCFESHRQQEHLGNPVQGVPLG